MAACVVLLRGVNVGGVVLKMADFRLLLEGLGCREVRTYIQSGNAVVQTGTKSPEALAGKIVRALAAERGLEVAVRVLGAEEFRGISAKHPLARGDGEEGLYVTLPTAPPAAGKLDELSAAAPGPELFAVEGGTVYGYYPDGYGKSKFANAWIEKRLGQPCTTRNWATMRSLAAMLES